MANDKHLAKRAQRDKKRRVRKMHNSVVRTANNAEHKAHLTAKSSVSKLRDDIYSFIMQKNGFRSYLINIRNGIIELKKSDDPKYDGMITSVYDKALDKLDKEIEPAISRIAEIIDNRASVENKITTFLDVSTNFQKVTLDFMMLTDAVNKYHNHNVSVYKGVEDPEHITCVDDSDFDFGYPAATVASTEKPAEESNAEVTDEDPNWTPGVISGETVVKAMLAADKATIAANAAAVAEEAIAAEAALAEGVTPPVNDEPNVMHDVEADIIVEDDKE